MALYPAWLSGSEVVAGTLGYRTEGWSYAYGTGILERLAAILQAVGSLVQWNAVWDSAGLNQSRSETDSMYHRMRITRPPCDVRLGGWGWARASLLR